jgi:hypothetical protein
VARGYAEGPAAEAAQDALERGDRAAASERAELRRAVWGSTADEPEEHFIGWLGEVDPDELFASGRAWGIHVTLQQA